MQKIAGKCHCGKNNFTAASEPEFQFVCYCDSCKALNSGGHLCGMLCDESKFTVATNTKVYSYKGGSGSNIDLHFCPTCSTQLYAYPREYPGKVVIRANTISGYDFESQQNLFSESAFKWDKVD